MKLRVIVRCADCGHETEVWVLGAWDIKDVRHECVGADDPAEETKFDVKFSPERRVF